MYTRAELKSKKYRDLQQIAKSYGLQYVGIKGDKIISLILKYEGNGKENKLESDGEEKNKSDNQLLTDISLTLVGDSPLVKSTKKQKINQDISISKDKSFELKNKSVNSTPISKPKTPNSKTHSGKKSYSLQNSILKSAKKHTPEPQKRSQNNTPQTNKTSCNEAPTAINDLVELPKNSLNDKDKPFEKEVAEEETNETEKVEIQIPKTVSRITKRKRKFDNIADKVSSDKKDADLDSTDKTDSSAVESPSKRRKSTRVPTLPLFNPSPSINKVTITPRSQRKSIIRPGMKSPTTVKTPIQSVSKIEKKDSPKISTPKFTIGRNDSTKKQLNKSGTKPKTTNIPRFMVYASKLKSKGMPDFSKLHQKDSNKMQDLKEYVDEKKKRNDTFAKIASEFKNPTQNSPAFKPSVFSTSNISFDFSKKKTPTKNEKLPKKSPQSFKKTTINKIPKSTNTKMSMKKIVPTSDLKKPLKAKPSMLKSPKNINNTKKVTSAIKLSAKKTLNDTKENKLMNFKPISTPTMNKITSSRVSTPGSIQRRREYDPKANLKKPLSYKPYTGALKPINDREKLKKMANKESNTKSSQQLREGQKTIIKGVRMNKRFELQMANRGLT